MHVIIFEMDHFEVAYPLIRMSLDAGYSVTAMIYPSCKEPLYYMLGTSVGQVNWIIKRENQSKRDFIKEIILQAKKINPQRIFISTVADNHLFFAKAIRQIAQYHPIVTLHSIHSFFKHSYKLQLRRWIRIFGKKKLIQQAPQLAVLSQSLLPYLETYLPKEKKVFLLPGSLYEGIIKQLSPSSHKCKIVVPGSIDTRRRNYEEVLSLAKKLEEKKLVTEITIIGTPRNKESDQIISQLRQWGGEYCRFHLRCEKVISQKEYDESIQKSHFLLAAQRTHFIAEDDIEEEYGRTIISGNIFDAVRNATPLLHPSFIDLDKRLQGMTITYDHVSQLCELIERFQKNEESYHSLLQNTYTCVQGFTSASQRSFLQELFPD